MYRIRDNIRDKEILDSEIILEMESIKHRDPDFNPNWTDYDNGCNILMLAVRYERKELIEYLLTVPGINVNYRSRRDNFTAFNLLCYVVDNIHILKLLLAHKDIDVNVQDKDGRTGLYYACCFRNIEFVRELLLDARIDIMLVIRNNWMKTSRHNWIRCRHNMLKRIGCTSLLRISNRALCGDIIRMIIEEYL